ncbi:MAG TPA: DUF1993 domain-containing protein [Kofleriaceae bacterium]|nr:DUF1993 domain-containing protein [Kofleriaceae bacterium]
MEMYDLTVPQLGLALRNIDGWMIRAVKHADTKQVPHDQLLSARLAPDQYPFVRQVQTACDNAKLIAARLAGKQAPGHPDTETTFEQLRARIAVVVEYLTTFTREDFAAAAERKIVLPWMTNGQHMAATDYVTQFGLPNFYFHVVTAYAILRNQGVPLGKNDFLGQITIRT